MSPLRSLKEFISQRLAAAVKEVVGHLERTITEYEQDMESRYRRLRDEQAAGNTAVVQEQLVIKEEAPDQQEWKPSPYKEEFGVHMEVGSGHTVAFSLTRIHVKSEDAEETTQSSQLHRGQTAVEMKTEAGGEACLGPERHRISVSDQAGSDGKTPHFSSAESQNDANDWKAIKNPQADLNTKKNRAPEIVTECNTDKKLFSCSKCGKKFGQKHHLLTHMRCHTGEKPFSCSLCGKQFTQKGNLTQHLTVHTREKPCSCSVCGERFAQKGNLTQHMTVHTREKPCSCSVCGERFAQKGNLAQHMTVHKSEQL